jgi:adenine-specific DNA methylase
MSNRRLIEDSLPLKKISEYSSKEKSIRHGHISTIHLWWARRPLAAARAATMAAMLPAPRDDRQREEFHELITSNLDWENAREPQEFTARLRQIVGTHWKGQPPKILDPFAGGGALPFEAERLGADTYATDLNPVAHLIEKATLGYPQRFVRHRSESSASDILTSKSRLVAEVDRWGRVVKQRAATMLGAFHPERAEGLPIFYCWGRTVCCPNPACRAEVLLVGTYFLSKKANEWIYLHPQAEHGAVRLTIKKSRPGDTGNFDPSKGTVTRATATCLCCAQAVPPKCQRRLRQLPLVI